MHHDQSIGGNANDRKYVKNHVKFTNSGEFEKVREAIIFPKEGEGFTETAKIGGNYKFLIND